MLAMESCAFVEYFGHGFTVWENVREKVVISCVI